MQTTFKDLKEKLELIRKTFTEKSVDNITAQMMMNHHETLLICSEENFTSKQADVIFELMDEVRSIYKESYGA